MAFFSFLWPTVLALVLMALGAYAEHPGLEPDAKKALEEIGQAGKYALALLIAAVPIKEVLERTLKEGGSDLRETIGSELGATGNKVATGLGNLTTVVQDALLKMRFTVELKTDDQSLKQSDDEVAKTVTDQSAVLLAREGKAVDAIAKINAETTDPKAKVAQQVAVLILSNHESDWERAAELLERGEAANTDSFHRLSFKFWSVGKVDLAIKLAEQGLALAGKSPHSETVALELKNNLAYFYADANRVDKKDLAFQYIHGARQQWPLNAEIYETEACVKIAFGDKEEALNGVRQCMEAARAKNDYTTLDHWLQRYHQRTF